MSRLLVLVHPVVGSIQHFVQTFTVMPFRGTNAEAYAKTLQVVARIPLLKLPMDSLNDIFGAFQCCIRQ